MSIVQCQGSPCDQPCRQGRDCSEQQPWPPRRVMPPIIDDIDWEPAEHESFQVLATAIVAGVVFILCLLILVNIIARTA